MNKEIKELLYKIKIWCDLAEYDKCNTMMYKHELVSILDYITNLQEENERLKEDLEEISSSHFSIFRRYTDYKSRNEKAIEYMNNTFNITSIKEFYEHLDNIENILQGSDNNGKDEF